MIQKHGIIWIYGFISTDTATYLCRKNRFTGIVYRRYFNQCFNYYTWMEIEERYYDKFKKHDFTTHKALELNQIIFN